MTAYCDSDWAGEKPDRRSTTGYIIYFGKTPIGWKSCSQKTVAKSSAEAEFIAAATLGMELKWLKLDTCITF